MNKYYYFYKLECNDSNCKEVYIGKTTSIYNRLHAHKNNCNNSNIISYNCKVYKFIRANGGWDNWLMYIIDEGTYSKEESKKIERKYIEKYGTLNQQFPGRTTKEYELKNKDIIRSQKKIYRLKNKEKYKAINKAYYLKNKEKYKEYRLNNKDKKKEYDKLYCLKNKDKKNAYQKQYRLINKK